MDISRWQFFWQAVVKYLSRSVEWIGGTVGRERVELDRMELELAERDRMMGGLRSP